MITYGVNTTTNGYVDVSKTLRGAKLYASRNGYDKVYARANGGYDVVLMAEKHPSGWLHRSIVKGGEFYGKDF